MQTETTKKPEKPYSILNERFQDALDSMLLLTVELQNQGFIDTSKETKEVLGDLLTARYLLSKSNNL
jgi:hypothetical protein